MPNPVPQQALTSSVDFTTLSTVTQAELNQSLQSLAGTIAGDALSGNGLVLTTYDSALNTPNVPNVAGYAPWTFYLWCRVPFTGAPAKNGVVYVWNPDAPNDATFLHWVSTNVDLTAVNASITALQVAVTTAQATATAANATANTALTNSSAAQTTATAANATANAASAAASAAQTTANNANTTANTANATANAANATAAAAQAAVAAITSSSVAVGPVAINAIGVGSALINQAHGLGAFPSKVRAVLKCINPAGFAGYALNEEVDIAFFAAFAGAGALLSPPFGTSTTNSNIRMVQEAASFIGVVHGTTGTSANNNLIAQADWQAKVYLTL